MPRHLVERSKFDVKEILDRGDHTDSRKAAWFAIGRGSDVILEVQRISPRQRSWTGLRDAYPFLNREAKKILEMRLQALAKFKQAPHHRQGFRLSVATGVNNPRQVNVLCLISGHEGQEIPGFVAYDRVVVDVEHMEQALGPATISEILQIRKKIGENVYISTNVSESPQIVRSAKNGQIDTRATAALTASKVLAALDAGVDVVKVGFAHMDEFKRDLRSEEVVRQMQIVREEVDQAVTHGAIVMPLNRARRYPLISVFFPEIGIDSHGERPMEIAMKAIDLTAQGKWQGVLIDTFEKFTDRGYKDFYSIEDTARLAKTAHDKNLEFWIAGSIALKEVPRLIKCKVDLICFGGAARHPTGQRTVVHGKRDDTIKRPLVEKLVRAFERGDPRHRFSR